MTAVPLLDSHKGCHCAPRASFFRRALRMPWRKPSAPAVKPAGAATALIADAQPVLGDRTIDDVRAQWNEWHDGTPQHDLLTTTELAALNTPAHLGPKRPTRLQRPDGEIVIDERNHVSVCPWPAAERPLRADPPKPERPDVTTSDLSPARYVPDVPAPVEFTTDPDVAAEALDALRQPEYGRDPAARVLEAERLSRVMQP